MIAINFIHAMLEAQIRYSFIIALGYSFSAGFQSRMLIASRLLKTLTFAVPRIL